MGLFKKSRNVINTLNNIKFCNYEARKTDLQLKNQETAREIAIGAPAISIIIRITNIIRPDNHAMLMLLLLSL